MYLDTMYTFNEDLPSLPVSVGGVGEGVSRR